MEGRDRYTGAIQLFRVPLEGVWERIPRKRPIKVEGLRKKPILVSAYTQPLRTFKQKGKICVQCGLEGSFFWVERAVNRDGSINILPHLALYGMRNGEEVLLTIDHIIPLRWGGKDNFANSQTMCWPCNAAKSTWKCCNGKGRHMKGCSAGGFLQARWVGTSRWTLG
jgi:hypothetical protein